jgi:photosystem II stability/assembly factor-like uncharacterized protein
VNKILKTTNAGESWTEVFSGGSNITLEEVRWVNAEIAIAGGFNFTTNNGYILRSTDGGDSWQEIPTSVVALLLDISFPNDSVGYICGGNTTILKTRNAGATWSVLLNENDSDLLSVYFVNESRGYAAGGLPGIGRVLQTVNGGQNWQDLSLAAPNLLQSVVFPTPSTGYVAGQGGILLKTNDSGDNWEALESESNLAILDMFFYNAQTGYYTGGSAGSSALRMTTDGGMTWVEETTDADVGLFSIDISGMTGLAVGVGGTVVRAEGLVSAVRDAARQEPGISVGPNPTRHFLQVHSDEDVIRDIAIYDQGGRQVRRVEAGEHNVQLDLSAFPSAIYYLLITTTDGVAVKKVMRLDD